VTEWEGKEGNLTGKEKLDHLGKAIVVGGLPLGSKVKNHQFF